MFSKNINLKFKYLNELKEIVPTPFDISIASAYRKLECPLFNKTLN